MPNKIIAIGDIHGWETWKTIVAKYPESHIVFLGDYCDPYFNTVNLIGNFKEIIEFKKKNKERVTLLLGNHDVHYFHSRAGRGSRYNSFLAAELKEIFITNNELFTCAYEDGTLLFTHAGVIQGWYVTEFSTEIDHVADRLNNPDKYHCNGDARYQCGPRRGGSDIYSGIFWADRNEIIEPLYGYTHIVGHTRVHCILPYYTYGHEKEPGIIFCDSLFKGNYLVIEKHDDGSHCFYAANIDEDTLQII